MPVRASMRAGVRKRFVSAAQTDNFNRADSTTTVGVASDGRTWLGSPTSWGIIGNKAYIRTGGAIYRDIGTNTQDVTVTIAKASAIGADPRMGICIASNTTALDNNGYQFFNNGGGTAFVRRRDTGAQITGLTTAAIGAACTMTAGVPATMRLTWAAGGTLKAYFNGTLVGTGTDTTFSGRYCGLEGDADGVPLTDFTYEDFIAVGS